MEKALLADMRAWLVAGVLLSVGFEAGGQTSDAGLAVDSGARVVDRRDGGVTYEDATTSGGSAVPPGQYPPGAIQPLVSTACSLSDLAPSLGIGTVAAGPRVSTGIGSRSFTERTAAPTLLSGT